MPLEAMENSRLTCAGCGKGIPACATCGRVGCPDPACHECLAERTGLPQNALWVLRQREAAGVRLEEFTPPPPGENWGN